MHKVVSTTIYWGMAPDPEGGFIPEYASIFPTDVPEQQQARQSVGFCAANGGAVDGPAFSDR